MANRKQSRQGVRDREMRDIGRRLLGYYLPYKGLFAAGLVCTLAVSGIHTYFLFLINSVVKAVIESDPRKLNYVALLIVGIHLLKWVFSYGQAYFVSSATQKIAIRLRNELFAHLQGLSLSFFERTKVGHLMSRMTNDVGVIQGSAPHIINAVSAPTQIIGMVAVIFYWNWKLSLVTLVALPFMAYTIIRIGRGMKNLTELLQIKLADVAAVVQETLSAVRVVKSFGMEDYEIARFEEENRRTYRSAMRTVRRNAAMVPTLELIGILGIAFVLWYGGNMVAQHQIEDFTAATLITFLVALERVAASAKDIGRIGSTYYQTLAGAKRIFDVLDEVPEIQDDPEAVEMPVVEGHVEFRNVAFSYNRNVRVLHDISFTIEPGQQVALVGPSGAGKSTITNLVLRLYDVTDGGVLIDGIDIRTVTLSSLRRQMAVVPQETILFSTSIRENIAYGRIDASQEEIVEAAKAANAHTFIEQLPEGYDTLVGERGARLSGGERQRVAIARALLKDPKILILDEATSSLDVSSEAIVQEALERLMRGRTTIVIAHRLSTVVNADKILVIKQGRVVESGAHAELLGLGGLYAELYNVQSKGAAIEGIEA